MIITFTRYAPEIGFLLGKHPDSLFIRDFSAGNVQVFYSIVSDDCISIAIVSSGPDCRDRAGAIAYQLPMDIRSSGTHWGR
jgi:hypothetical protein